MKNIITTEKKQNSKIKISVVEKIIFQMREAISSGYFSPGDKLPNEFDLMERFSASRNSIREAMKILSTLGIVEVHQGDGTYLCTEVKTTISDFLVYSILLEKSNADEIIELRQILDEDILTLATKKCTDENIERLQFLIDSMRFYFEEGNISEAAKLDYEFHIYLCECCQNKFLSKMVSSVYQLFEGSIEENIRSGESFADADKHHQKIVDCIKNKDFNKIPLTIKETLSTWERNVKRGDFFSK